MTHNMTIKEDHYNVNSDWYNWESVPLKPEWLNKQIMDKCNTEGIPLQFLRIKRENGREEFMILRKRIRLNG